MKKKIRTLIEISIGVLLLAVGYFFFQEPTGLCVGGISGIAVILDHTPLKDQAWYSSSLFIYAMDIILLILALALVSKKFFLKTVYASLLYPTIILIFEKANADPYLFLKTVPSGNQYMISMLVGGTLTAVGIALALKAGASTGGMDVLQKILQKYFHIPYSKSMYLTDWLVVLVSGFFIKNIAAETSNVIGYNVEGVVFGLITVFLVGYICDYIALNARNRRTAYIITNNVDDIKEFIFDTLGRGVTIVDVTGGYTNEKKKMLICTLEKKECYILRDEIERIDPQSFTFFSETKEINGYYE